VSFHPRRARELIPNLPIRISLRGAMSRTHNNTRQSSHAGVRHSKRAWRRIFTSRAISLVFVARYGARRRIFIVK
jgi:hypothetical protein